MNECIWDYHEHLSAMKKIYAASPEKLQKEMKDYITLMKENRFDDFDEHLLLQSICVDYFKKPLMYYDHVIIQDGQYIMRPTRE